MYRQARIQDSEGGGGFVQEFRLENRSYPDVHDFSLRMQVIIANANNIADSRRGGGGGSEHPPLSAPDRLPMYVYMCSFVRRPMCVCVRACVCVCQVTTWCLGSNRLFGINYKKNRGVYGPFKD